jgi:transposase
MSEAAEEPVIPTKARLSKIDEKRQEIFRERVSRKMGEGKTEDQAVNAILREDYNALPLDQKFARLESMVSGTIQSLMSNINTLRQNERVVADAFDINYRAVEKMFKRLGIPEEEQNAIIDECRKNVIAERAQFMAEQEAAQQAQAGALSEKAVSDELTKAEQKPVGLETVDERPVGPDPHVEAGATEFGT